MSDEQISGCAELIRRDRLRTKDLAGALNSRGIGYYEKGDLDRAISDFTRAIRLNPKDAYTFNNRGQTYYAKDRLGRAIADYNRAIRIDPQDATAFFNRGIWYHEQGNLDRAIADYSRAARINPQILLSSLNAAKPTMRGAISTALSSTTVVRSGWIPSSHSWVI